MQLIAYDGSIHRSSHVCSKRPCPKHRSTARSPAVGLNSSPLAPAVTQGIPKSSEIGDQKTNLFAGSPPQSKSSTCGHGEARASKGKCKRCCQEDTASHNCNRHWIVGRHSKHRASHGPDPRQGLVAAQKGGKPLKVVWLPAARLAHFRAVTLTPSRDRACEGPPH
jgi:hypothetical protein